MADPRGASYKRFHPLNFFFIFMQFSAKTLPYNRFLLQDQWLAPPIWKIPDLSLPDILTFHQIIISLKRLGLILDVKIWRFQTKVLPVAKIQAGLGVHCPLG